MIQDLLQKAGGLPSGLLCWLKLWYSKIPGCAGSLHFFGLLLHSGIRANGRFWKFEEPLETESLFSNTLNTAQYSQSTIHIFPPGKSEQLSAVWQATHLDNYFA